MINSGSKVDLTKKLYDKKAYLNVINTQFNELSQPIPSTEPEINIDEFFQLYNDLFYDIPKFGETNSHEYLIKQSSDYVGSAVLTDDIQALLDEITSLREENLELQRNIIDLTTNTNS
jgi:hypothetical protein